jgi:hypothetical protein
MNTPELYCYICGIELNKINRPRNTVYIDDIGLATEAMHPVCEDCNKEREDD